MKIAGTYKFEASLETTWDALFNADVLARTLPGCDKLEKEGDQFNGVIRVKMGPVQGKFQGKVNIEDVVEHDNYRMVIDGRGPAGFAKAKVSIRLVAEGAQTEMSYEADIQIGGKIASVGQRLLDASIKAITKQSLESLHTQIKVLQAEANGEREPQGESAAAPATSAEGTKEVSNPNASGKPEQPSAKEVVSPAPVEGPSQAAFAMGVAKEVTRELLPLKKVILVGAVIVLVVALYQVLTKS